MYKEVAHVVLIYDSKNWVLTGEMLNILKGFRHRAARRITGMKVKFVVERKW